MFRFVLLLPDETPCDPPCLVTTANHLDVGAEISLVGGTRVRVVESDDAAHTHLRALGFSGVLTVEPL
jgi:hypothetical protein